MPRKHLLIPLLLLVALALSLAGCAKRVAEPVYTPQEQAERNSAKWLHIWNAQFNDHKYMAELPNLTDQQKTMLNKKADLLGRSKPLLDSYVRIVKGGGIPSTADEVTLTNLMNELSQMALSFTPQPK